MTPQEVIKALKNPAVLAPLAGSFAAIRPKSEQRKPVFAPPDKAETASGYNDIGPDATVDEVSFDAVPRRDEWDLSQE